MNDRDLQKRCKNVRVLKVKLENERNEYVENNGDNGPQKSNSIGANLETFRVLWLNSQGLYQVLGVLYRTAIILRPRESVYCIYIGTWDNTLVLYLNCITST